METVEPNGIPFPFYVVYSYCSLFGHRDHLEGVQQLEHKTAGGEQTPTSSIGPLKLVVASDASNTNISIAVLP